MADGSSALSVLQDDHARVRTLFTRFRETTDRALKTRADLFRRVDLELQVHTRIEEELFYPAAGEREPGLIRQAIEEHRSVEKLLAELRDTPVTDHHFDERMRELIRSVERHVREEEGELFPRAQRQVGSDRLRALGQQMTVRKQEIQAQLAPGAGTAGRRRAA
jgi:hemerythrin superfamily protein